MKKGYITINQAAAEFGKDAMYIRKLLREGRLLKAAKSAIPGTKIPRWSINRAELAEYLAKPRTRREDGRNKFVLYATAEELAELQSLLKESKLGVILKRANPPKRG